MYVRLAFAVAAHLEPEILIVDEVLAVGDTEFQKKCLGKMDEVSRRDGRTILVVSHNMGVVTSLCPNAIWLENGSILRRGDARTVIADYHTRLMPKHDRIIHFAVTPRVHSGDDDRLRLQSLEWLSDLPLRHGEPVKARIRFETRAPVSAVTVGIGFSNLEGTRLLTYDADFENGFRPDLPSPGEYAVDVVIDALPIAPDVYNLDVGCRSGDFHALDYVPACSQLDVTAGPTTPSYIIQKGAGTRLSSQWSWDLDGLRRKLQSVR
jgi:lipopolysaccharide transport system ATP-binding protein